MDHDEFGNRTKLESWEIINHESINSISIPANEWNPIPSEIMKPNYTFSILDPNSICPAYWALLTVSFLQISFRQLFNASVYLNIEDVIFENTLGFNCVQGDSIRFIQDMNKQGSFIGYLDNYLPIVVKPILERVVYSDLKDIETIVSFMPIFLRIRIPSSYVATPLTTPLNNTILNDPELQNPMWDVIMIGQTETTFRLLFPFGSSYGDQGCLHILKTADLLQKTIMFGEAYVVGTST